MKPRLTAAIIGAGGVTSYMMPSLLRSFNLQGVLYDGDILEPHNLDRQLFSKNQIGMNKASALIKNLGPMARSVSPISEYFTSDTVDKHRNMIWGVDLIIAAVDNHEARLAALNAADALNVPCITAANEYVTSQVMYYLPRLFKDTQADPRVRYPEILTDKSGSPLACQGLLLESSPQLAIANQVSASLANLMTWLWVSEPVPEDNMQFMPVEYQTTFSKIETLTYGDLNQSGPNDDLDLRA